MAVQQQARVLPSNAPPFWGNSQQNKIITRRSCKKRSEKQGHDIFGHISSGEQGNSLASLRHNSAVGSPSGSIDLLNDFSEEESGSSYSDFLQSSAAARPDRLRSSTFGSSNCRSVPSTGQRDEQLFESEAAALWRELQQCEAYQKYRDRQDPKKGKKEQKWPEDAERAFFRALVRWPPKGRQQFLLDGVKKGRNECISAYIEKETRVFRKRKQISSHIQNLRPMFRDHPHILQYLPNQKRQSQNAHSNHRSSRRGNTRRRQPMLEDAYSELIPQLQPYDARQLDVENLLPGTLQVPEPVIEPFYFEMFVPDPCRSSLRHLHTFTKFHKGPKLPDAQIHELQDGQRLAHLVSITDGVYQKTAPVLYCEASLKLMTDPLPEGAKLGIQFELTAGQDLGSLDISCCTRIFDGDTCVDEDSGRVEYDAGGARRLHKVPFGINFWAHKLGTLAKELRQGLKTKKEHSMTEEQFCQSDREWRESNDLVSSYIQNLSAFQEIHVSKPNEDRSDLVLLIYWRFSHTTHAASGTTTWRYLVRPAAQRVHHSSSSGELEDSAIEDRKIILDPGAAPFTQNHPDLSAAPSLGFPPAPFDISASPVTAAALPHKAYSPTSALSEFPAKQTDYSGLQLDLGPHALQQSGYYEDHQTQAHNDYNQLYERLWPNFTGLASSEHGNAQHFDESSERYDDRRDYAANGVGYSSDAYFNGLLPSLHSHREVIEAP